MKDAIFSSMSGPDPGVFDSQVLDYGSFMRSLGLEFRYLLFEGLQAWRKSRGRISQTLDDIRHRYGASIEIQYILRPLSALGLRQAEYRMTREARKLADGRDPILIQARGVQAAWVAARVKRSVPSAVLLYDARADVSAEALLEARHCDSLREREAWEQRARMLESLEVEAARGADHVLAVSTPLRERLRALAGLPAGSISVIPCCVNLDRFEVDAGARDRTRSQLGVGSRTVLVYAGSLSVWQIPDRVAELVEEVCEALQEVHLLVLTRDTAAGNRYFERLILTGRCTVIDCPYGEVGGYLHAADLGLLLREVDAVNLVASPVKFAEYQACGLPVIVTPGIGDVSDYIQATGFGLVVDLERPKGERISEMIESIRSRRWERLRPEIGKRAREKYSRESYRSTYEEILGRLGVIPMASQAQEGGSKPAGR